MQRRASSSYGPTIAPRRTHVDAGGAAPAMSAHRRIHRQREIGEHLTQEEPGPRVAVEQVRVLADPAEAGIARECLLEHRCAVGERAVAGGARGVGELPGESRETRAQHRW